MKREIKLNIKINIKKRWNINKFDYQTLMLKIQLLELKIKKISITKEYLNITKPSIIEFKKKKKWTIKYKNNLKSEKKVIEELETAYMELEKILP